MKSGDYFEIIIQGTLVKGKIVRLAPYAIGVSIETPFKHSRLLKIYSEEEVLTNPYAVTKNGRRETTERGDEAAKMLLKRAYEEACYLVNNKERVRDMIERIIEVDSYLLSHGIKDYYCEGLFPQKRPFNVVNSNICNGLQCALFPEISPSNLEMDGFFLDSFSKQFLGKEYYLIDRQD